MSVKKWLLKNTHSLRGKTVAVSGSTGGLGRQLCLHLAALGADLLLLDRSSERAGEVKQILEGKYPDVKVSYIRLDLSDMECVKSVTQMLIDNIPDVLILNAGIYHVPRYKCESGFDNVFQVNFIAPYYMARTLKPYMQKRGGKIIAVGSIAHNYSKIDLSDIDFSLRKKSSKVYGNSKRFLMYSLFGLYSGEDGLAVVHPGITYTNITSHYPKVIFALIKHPMKVIFMPPRVASLSIIKGIFTDCHGCEWIGPCVFDIWGNPKKKKLRTASDGEYKSICETADNIFRTL